MPMTPWNDFHSQSTYGFFLQLCFNKVLNSSYFGMSSTVQWQCRDWIKSEFLTCVGSYFDVTNSQQIIRISWNVGNPCETFAAKTAMWCRHSYEPGFRECEDWNQTACFTCYNCFRRLWKIHLFYFDFVKPITNLCFNIRCLSGNWLLFIQTGTGIDEAWEKIATATVKDKLGTHAKVTPLEDVGEGKALHGQEHAVSVYTRDFTDKADVMKMEGKLRDLGLRGRMAYKPRFYSIIGVYGQNKWRLRPGIYSSHWDEVNNEASVRDNTISYQTKKAYRY